MFNSSLRSVARNCPNASIPTRSVTTSKSSKSVAAFSTRCHQRRHSSSKPPVPPNNGSPPIPEDSVKQVGTPRSNDKRTGAESRQSKRKVAKSEKTEPGKQVQEAKGNEWTLQLPSVPSTQHLNPKGMAQSTHQRGGLSLTAHRCLYSLVFLHASTNFNQWTPTARDPD